MCFKKIRVGFVAVGLVLWGLASYLFCFIKWVETYDDVGITVAFGPAYGIESVILFAAGTAVITFALVYKMSLVKKRGIALTTLGTSLMALGAFLTFGAPIELLSTHMPYTFGVVISIMIGLLILALSTIIISHALHNKL
jgi:hypothetical protein